MAMKKIPSGEQSLLCASVFVNNFKRVIEELVYNSLDAGSSSIAIRVSLQDHVIQVLDNGNGISKDNFGLLGQKYATSKYVDTITLKSAPDKYGFRGLSLASIIDVSQSVKISSRHEHSDTTWQKTFYKGKEKEISETLSRPSKGTTVEIKGFLYNLNMQRKLIDPHTELDKIKTALKQLSLVHYNASFSLRDDSKNDIILQIHKNRTVYDTMKSVFQINETDIQEFQVEKNEYKVKAFIGKTTVESNNYYQWIYINGRFIHKSILHHKLNIHLSKYSSKSYRINKKMHAQEDENIFYDSNVPFYFIFITCPNYDFDITYNSEKSLIEFKDWKELDKLIEKLVQFYSGGLASKIKVTHKIDGNEKKSETKLQLKEIVDKILNNKNKMSKMELQNGINGKILKRNVKKKKKLSTKKILKNTTETNNLFEVTDYSKPSNVNISSKEHLKLQSVKSKTPNDSRLMPIYIKNKMACPKAPKINKCRKQVHISKKESNKLKKKNKVKNDLTKKFQPSPETIAKQCKRIFRRARNLLNNKGLKQYSPYEEAVNYEKLSLIEKSYKKLQEDNKINNYQLVKKSHDLLKAIVSSQYDMTENNRVLNNFNNQMVKRSYDLLKAVVLSSQCNMMENKNNNLNYSTHTYKRKSYEDHTYQCNITNIPMTTYNSHINYNYEIRRMGCFRTGSSRNNFFSKEQEPQDMNKNKYLKSTEQIKKTNLLNIYDQVQQESSYTIEITENHKVISSTIQPNDCNNLLKDGNHTKSIHLENTFTLEGFVRSLRNNDNINLNETYLSKLCNSLRACHLGELQSMIVQDTADNEIEKSNFIVPESESDSVETMQNIVEPFNYHEAILQSQSTELRELEKEFEQSFFNKKSEQQCSNNIVRNEEIYNGDELNNINSHSCENLQNQNQHLNIRGVCHRLSLNHNHYKQINNCVEVMYGHELDKNPGYISLSKNQEVLPFWTDNHVINNEPIHDFHLKSRYRFMPKGMSPIMNNAYEFENAYTLNRDEECYKDMLYENFANDVLKNTEIFEPTVQKANHLFSKHVDKVNNELQKHNADLIFDSVSLIQAKVVFFILGQVDRKFIVSTLNGRSVLTGKSSEFLVLFDQHAVDERIRLENNLSAYMENGNWKSTAIDPVSIVLNKDDYLYFINQKDKLASFGLQWAFSSDNKMVLNAIPTAIIGKNQRQVEIVMRAVKKLISEQIQAIRSLRGNIPLYPKSIMELVFSEACRYAIKFGDKLSKTECTNMINSLASCKTPFQCAHGRPVMAVLMELKNKSSNYKVNLSKVKKFMKMPS